MTGNEKVYALGTVEYQFELPVKRYVMKRTGSPAQDTYALAYQEAARMCIEGEFSGYDLVEVYAGKSQPATIGVLDALTRHQVPHCLMWHNALRSALTHKDVYERVYREGQP